MITEINNVLITGGAGFIGSRLAIKLSSKGYKVTVLDNLSRQIHGPDPGKSDLFQSISEKARFIRGDVRSIDNIHDAIDHPCYVFHFAAETGTGQSMYEIERYTQVNVQGTANLLQVAANKKKKIKKIILASSRAIYGEGLYHCGNCGKVTPNSRTQENMTAGEWSMFCPNCSNTVTSIPTTEDAPPDPRSIYAITKYTQELLIKQTCLAYGIPFVILRYQNVYGAGQSMVNPYTGVLTAFVNRIMSGMPPEIFEDGTEARDFVHIEDVTQANIKAILTNKCNNHIINIGSGEPTPIKKAAELLIETLGSDLTPHVNGKFRVGDIYKCFADISLAVKYLNFRPETSFKKGIQDFVRWAKEQGQDPDVFAFSLQEMAQRGLYL